MEEDLKKLTVVINNLDYIIDKLYENKFYKELLFDDLKKDSELSKFIQN